MSLPAEGEHKKEFLELYAKHLGWKVFVFPGLALLASIVISIWWVRGGPMLFPSIEGDQNGLPPVAVAAVLGAYMWSLSEFTAKSLRRALAPRDLWWVSFRLVIAVPLAYSLTGFVKDDFGVPVAFLLGVFPTQTLMNFSRRLARKKLDLGEGPKQQESEVQALQSIDSRIAERLVDENILTNLQLAYADPIVLCIRTNLGFNTVVDYVSQALLWIYLEDDTAKLRKFGLRGAQEVRSLWGQLNGTSEAKAEAEKTLKAVAGELGMADPDALRNTFDEVANDPYTEFLWDVWG